MNKKYRTSVRRAANLLVRMDYAHDYTSSFSEDELINLEIQEVIQWLVDRDARQRAQIKNFVKERIRNAAV